MTKKGDEGTERGPQQWEPQEEDEDLDQPDPEPEEDHRSGDEPTPSG